MRVTPVAVAILMVSLSCVRSALGRQDKVNKFRGTLATECAFKGDCEACCFERGFFDYNDRNGWCRCVKKYQMSACSAHRNQQQCLTCCLEAEFVHGKLLNGKCGCLSRSKEAGYPNPEVVVKIKKRKRATHTEAHR